MSAAPYTPTPRQRETGPRWLPVVAGMASAAVMLGAFLVSAGTAVEESDAATPTTTTSSSAPSKPKPSPSATADHSNVDKARFYSTIQTFCPQIAPAGKSDVIDLGETAVGLFQDGVAWKDIADAVDSDFSDEGDLFTAAVYTYLLPVSDWTDANTTKAEKIIQNADPGSSSDDSTDDSTSDLTTSQEQAVQKAQSYLDMGGFSRSGLIKQLRFEKFSNKDATFAVDYLDPNWNEQAEQKAQSYMDLGSRFSRGSLINQLVFEGFTQKQAEHGAKSVGL